MHPRTREVRAPDSGIDPRGSGDGQPPLLQGFLKHRKPAPKPEVPAKRASRAKAAVPAASKATKAAAPKPAAPKPAAPKAAAPKAGAKPAAPKAAAKPRKSASRP